MKDQREDKTREAWDQIMRRRWLDFNGLWKLWWPSSWVCYPVDLKFRYTFRDYYRFTDFSCGSDSKVSVYNAGDLGSIPGLGRSPGEGNGNPLQYYCLEKSHGQRSLVGYSPWGHIESDTTERLHFTSLQIPSDKQWLWNLFKVCLTIERENSAAAWFGLGLRAVGIGNSPLPSPPPSPGSDVFPACLLSIPLLPPGILN